jgi:hypothetical protein
MAPAADEGGTAKAGLPPSKPVREHICVLPDVGIHQQPVPPDMARAWAMTQAAICAAVEGEKKVCCEARCRPLGDGGPKVGKLLPDWS